MTRPDVCDRPARARRSCLVVPANSKRMLGKARGLPADEVIVDLEDAVPVVEKTSATREAAAAALRLVGWRAPTRAVRVNAVGTPWFRDDSVELVEGAGAHLHAIVVPKVESAETLVAVDQLLTELEHELGLSPIDVEAQIETALGLTRVEEIASAVPRLAALVFGAGDYAASLDIAQPVIGAASADYPGDRWHYPRSRIAVAAHANGLAPIDTPYAAFHDHRGLLETAEHARLVGFVGKWSIHAEQIEACNRVFTPTDAEIADARRVLRVADDAGRGATAEGATMVDEASRRAAAAALARLPSP